MSSALEKAVAVLEAVVERDSRFGLSEVARHTGLSRQAAHRVMRQLTDSGLLTHDPFGERYLVGHRLKRLSLSALTAAQRGSAAHEVLRSLVSRLGETCNVGMLDGLEVVYVDRVECDWPLRLQLQPGSRLPAHCSAIGKLLLAYLPAKSRRRLLASASLKRYTPHTVTDPARLEQELASIRAEGLATNDQEYMVGLLGIAVPIRDNVGEVAAALAVHAPLARMGEAEARAHLPELREAAEALCRAFDSDGGGAGRGPGD
jgi:DNA-binding IclR family transcriptional regulator